MKKQKSKGMGLVEVLVAVAIFVFVSMAVYQAYSGLLALVSLSRVKITAANLVSEQFEIAKNLPYASVGTIAGVPSGVLAQNQTLVRDGKSFNVKITVRNIDDTFDGIAGGSPNDISPADYKLVEVEVSCDTCKNFNPIVLSARVSPKSLEAASTNGSLFITVFDANGNPVEDATVRVVNTASSIDLTDVTNVDGKLLLIDTPPGNQNYEITVTKTGYSSDRTYLIGEVSNPNPSKPHATVAVQTVTDISFSIDRTSTIEVSTVRNTCSAVGNVDFDLRGAKLIGTGPDVYKYDASHETDGSGLRTVSSLEWDSYGVTMTDPSYYLEGTISPLPIALSPNSTQNAAIVVSDVIPNAYLVSVKDNATGLPLSGVNVLLEQGGGFSESRVTGRGFLRQTDWSGGGGEEDATSNPDSYWSDDGNIENNSPQGVVKLDNVFGNHAPSGQIESSTFDTGSSADFFDISWEPTSQPVSAGADSVKFQVATSNDDEGPWTYSGPDGTSATYYTVGDRNIHTSNNGKRYFRYKMFLATEDTLTTPTVSDVAFTFTSACAPPGQVLFNNLSAGNYTITVTKAGYQDYVQPVSINAGWQSIEVPLLLN